MDGIANHEAWAIRARYLLPVDSPPLRDSVLSVFGSRIVGVGENTSQHPPLDLGTVAILPGFVNAHTHLEFSDLEQPLGRPGMRMPDWIREVVSHRRRCQALDSQREPDGPGTSSAIRWGLAESQRAGVTSLGEIATRDWDADFPATPIGCTLFREQMALQAARIQDAYQRARDWLTRSDLGSRAWRRAISPHAPYTVHPDLLGRLCRLSREQAVPLAMHLAESPEELELLASASGAFVSLLNELGAWDPAAIPRGIQPLDYLRELAIAYRVLVIHGNFLGTTEIEFLAGQAGHMSVIYCPRTHAYFEHGRYPLGQFLSAGVNVAVGTDSRASNPDLSLFEELRFVAERFPGIAPDAILRMGTIQGARALGIDGDTGSLKSGKRADFVVLALPTHDADDPHELVFHPEARVLAVYAAGQLL